MKSGYQYKVITEIDTKKIPKILVPVFSKLKIGDTFTAIELYKKYKDEIDIKNKNNLMSEITRASRLARENGMLERIGNSIVPKWFTELKTVSIWQSQLRGSKYKNSHGSAVQSTRVLYLGHLWHFNRWLSGKKFPVRGSNLNKRGHRIDVDEIIKFKNVEGMVVLLNKRYTESKDVAKIVKAYLMDKVNAHKKATSLQGTKSAIWSYFDKNECEITIRYDPKATHNTEIEEKEMTLSNLVTILTTGKPTLTEKAVILCKFHRGLDTSTMVDRFNYEAWDQMVKWFGSSDYKGWNLDKCPVPISLMRLKTNYQHVGYLDHDAITSLQEYLVHRKKKTGEDMRSGEALFLTKYNLPITVNWLTKSFIRITERSGAQSYTMCNGKKIKKIDLHEMRDLLKSTLIECGCRQDVADHVIGHRVGDSYEKQFKLYPESVRMEYAKVSSKVNVFSSIKSVLDGNNDVSSLKRELNDALATQKRMEEENILRAAAMKRYDDALNERLRQIDEWEEKMKAAKERDDAREKDMQNALEEIRKLKSQMSAQ